MAKSNQRRVAKAKQSEGVKKASVAIAKRNAISSRRVPEQKEAQPESAKSINVLQGLIEKHRSIAFIGIIHDNLLQTFRNVLADDPDHTWEKIYVFFPSNSCLKALTRNYARSMEQMIIDKKTCKYSLSKVLSSKVKDLRFMEYDQLLHCGSYWDWDAKGGFIHVSPLTWGANAKICPAINYTWDKKEPSQNYQVYRDGLEYLLRIATTLE